jgi:ribosomal protein S27AE
MNHIVGFINFILSAFRDPEPYQPVTSCTGFEMVDGVLTPINITMTYNNVTNLMTLENFCPRCVKVTKWAEKKHDKTCKKCGLIIKK